MKRLMFVFLALAPACALDTGNSQDDLDAQANGKPDDAVVHWARGEAKPGGGAGSPNLVYHGGTVMTAGAYVEPIFWGTSWSSSSFVADKVTGMQAFYSGMSGSSYDKTNSEYTDTSGGHVGSGVTLGAVHIDTSASAKSGSRTSPILAEVCKEISNPRTNGYYPVYIDHPRGHAGYCAWHSTGTCNGVQVQFAFFFDLDGDPGCDPGANGSHTQGTAALGNVSGHELSETLTDQHLDAWYDSSGAENADKCAWKFGSSMLNLGGTSWRVQGNWSNAAYNANQGYGGNIGCIDGTN